jgi:hypothetical protein
MLPYGPLVAGLACVYSVRCEETAAVSVDRLLDCSQGSARSNLMWSSLSCWSYIACIPGSPAKSDYLLGEGGFPSTAISRVTRALLRRSCGRG